MKNVINIVNFIRGCDIRPGFDLKRPIREQVKLAQKYNMPMTFLYQYDAMVKPGFTDLLKGKDGFELGVWIECSIWLVEKVGLPWRGREGYEWDWHSNVDMTVGYTIDERRLLIDEIMRKFNESFGYYPKTVGSWALDAYSIRYMKEKYNIDVALICRDQWGTDGYSLWGGYYSGAYYPCKNNIFSPAQSAEEQIDVPVFRMLGSDPIDQYMNGIGTEWQQVETMEPSYPMSGGNEKWVSWYLDEMFGEKNLGINYCQAGQENSFGWEKMKNGYTIQMKLFDEKRKNGQIDFEFVSETGRNFKKKFGVTPVTTIDAHKENCGAFWFNSKFYRSSLYFYNGKIMLRDVFIFNENRKERYFERVADGPNLYFDNLPLIDCFRWSKENELGGAYFKYQGREIGALSDFETKIIDNNSVAAKVITEIGNIEIFFNEKSVRINFPNSDCSLEAISFKDKPTANMFVDSKLLCKYENFDYSIIIKDANCLIENNGYRIKPYDKSFELIF